MQVVIPSSFVIMILLLSVTVKIFFYKGRSSKAKSTVNVESSEDNSTEHLQVSAAEDNTKTNEQHFGMSSKKVSSNNRVSMGPGILESTGNFCSPRTPRKILEYLIKIYLCLYVAHKTVSIIFL